MGLWSKRERFNKKMEQRKKFTQADRDYCWSKANKIQGFSTNKYRTDKCGNVIYKSSYGKRCKYGWEIDHSKPMSKGGTNHLNNLQAMQWKQNNDKGVKYPYKYKEVKRKGVSVSEFKKSRRK